LLHAGQFGPGQYFPLTMVAAMIAALVAVKKAPPSSLPKVLEILSAVGLPHEGVEEHFDGFLIAQSGNGQTIGCIGLESHGDLGLLRSAAVLPQYQGQSAGGKLIRQLLRLADEKGHSEIVLLTTTAKDYFQSKFGFREAKRSGYEDRLVNSPEWHLPRCSSAAFMTLKLHSMPHSTSKPGENKS
jgi:N-acetylglutamate synthase-like GNAT family acetyltransferase